MSKVLSVCLAILLMSIGVCAAQPQGVPESGAAPDVPEREIASLSAELKRHMTNKTFSAKSRRVFKSIARKGKALLEASPEAANRCWFVTLAR